MKDKKNNLTLLFLANFVLVVISISLLAAHFNMMLAAIVGSAWAVFFLIFIVTIKNISKEYFLSGENLPPHPFRIVAIGGLEATILEDELTGELFPVSLGSAYTYNYKKGNIIFYDYIGKEWKKIKEW